MPRKRSRVNKEDIKDSATPPIEEQGIDDLIDMSTYTLKKAPSDMTPWEKLKVVLKLRHHKAFSDIAELLEMKSISVKRMDKLSREALQSRGIDPDRFYKLLQEGVSYWTMIPYLNDPEFIKIVNGAMNADDFTVKFKDYKSRGIPKRSMTKFTLTLREVLDLYFLDNYRVLLERNRANLTLNEPFKIRIEPIYGMFFVDDDNRVVLTLWEEDDPNEPIYVGTGDSDVNTES